MKVLATMVIVLAVLAACDKSNNTTDRCAATVAKIMGPGPKGDSWARKTEDEKQRVLAMRAETAKTVTESCRTQHWSTELIDCVEKADDSKAGLRKCEELFTPAQTAAITDALTPKTATAPTGDAERAARAKQAAIERDQAASELAELEKAHRAADAKVASAREALAAAKTAAEREAATAVVHQHEQAVAELAAQVKTAMAKLARAERLRGVAVTKECLDNPLAKGCN